MTNSSNNLNDKKFIDVPKIKEHPNYEITNNYHLDSKHFEEYEGEVKPYLLIGYDTEYQSPDEFVEDSDDENLDDVKEEDILEWRNKGVLQYKYSKQTKQYLLKNRILSYQTYCRIIIPKFDSKGNFLESISNGYEWECIVHPSDSMNHILSKGVSNLIDGRLTLHEVLHYTLAQGIRKFPNITIPTNAYLLSHFSRADIPSLKDYEWNDSELVKGLMNIRGVYTGRKDIKVPIIDNVNMKVKLRDTINLAPTLKKSLNDIGKMLGFPKIEIGNTEDEELKNKENMDDFMFNNYELFKKYGIQDAKIVTEYAHQLININMKETGKYILPNTLTSSAVSKLISMWSKEKWIQDIKKPELEICGKRKLSYKRFNSKTQRLKKVTYTDYIDKVKWRVDFVANTYHGGRNEQFLFGSTWIDEWKDWDLTSAYPTAMCMIGLPDWNKTKTIYDINKLWELDIDDLGFAQVDFEFPPSVRYPCLPVRGGEQGLLFPLKGMSLCSIQELKLAKKMMEDVNGKYNITLHEAVTVPTDKSKRIFESFIKYCIDERNKAKEINPKSLMNYFWKEMSNSTYGKTAQGLRIRKVYNLQDEAVENLKESQITNPFFASFITGIVRASLAEIMNKLPNDKCVFSVTTDGFLTNANKNDIDKCQDGEICIALKKQRQKLVNDSTILEVKHQIKQGIGWRTRGQGTLKESEHWNEEKDIDNNIVIAKSGIKLKDKYEKKEENRKIVKWFLNRKWNHKLLYKNFSGIREIHEFKIDLVKKPIEKKLSMEYDWKRKPSYTKDVNIVFDGKEYTHIYMETKPWNTLEEFILLRNKLEDFNNNNTNERCIKTVKDYKNFKNYIDSKLSLPKQHQPGLSKTKTEEKRIKSRLLSGWRHRQGGMIKFEVPIQRDDEIKWKTRGKLSYKDWIIIFKTVDIELTEYDFSNSRVQPREYTPHSIPKTETSIKMLNKLKENHFPFLKIDELLSNVDRVGLLDKDEEETQFLKDKSRVFK